MNPVKSARMFQGRSAMMFLSKTVFRYPVKSARRSLARIVERFPGPTLTSRVYKSVIPSRVQSVALYPEICARTNSRKSPPSSPARSATTNQDRFASRFLTKFANKFKDKNVILYPDKSVSLFPGSSAAQNPDRSV